MSQTTHSMAANKAPDLGDATGSRAAKRPTPDWDALTFSFTETDVMYCARGDTTREPIWEPGEYQPFGELRVSPAAAFLSYGLGIFEGLKAQRSRDGRILLFRHRDNGVRFQRSAERLLMACFPVDQFVDAVEEIVRRNERFVPPHGKGTLYVRPVEHAIEPKLGLGPCHEFWTYIYGSPVGSYFSSKAAEMPAGLRLRVLEQGRVAPGGTGNAKAMGNYAGGIAIATKWKQQGYDDVLYLEAAERRFVTETSGSNVFVKLKGGTVVTPPLDDQILPGITRDSAVKVAREVFSQQVDERPISIDEVLDDGEEIFCTGTAWTVRNIGELVHRERSYKFPRNELQQTLLNEIVAYQTGEKEDPFGWVHEVKS